MDSDVPKKQKKAKEAKARQQQQQAANEGKNLKIKKYSEGITEEYGGSPDGRRNYSLDSSSVDNKSRMTGTQKKDRELESMKDSSVNVQNLQHKSF